MRRTFSNRSKQLIILVSVIFVGLFACESAFSGPPAVKPPGGVVVRPPVIPGGTGGGTLIVPKVTPGGGITVPNPSSRPGATVPNKGPTAYSVSPLNRMGLPGVYVDPKMTHAGEIPYNERASSQATTRPGVKRLGDQQVVEDFVQRQYNNDGMNSRLGEALRDQLRKQIHTELATDSDAHATALRLMRIARGEETPSEFALLSASQRAEYRDLIGRNLEAVIARLGNGGGETKDVTDLESTAIPKDSLRPIGTDGAELAKANGDVLKGKLVFENTLAEVTGGKSRALSTFKKGGDLFSRLVRDKGLTPKQAKTLVCPPCNGKRAGAACSVARQALPLMAAAGAIGLAAAVDQAVKHLETEK